jgi:hypothetical protein
MILQQFGLLKVTKIKMTKKLYLKNQELKEQGRIRSDDLSRGNLDPLCVDKLFKGTSENVRPFSAGKNGKGDNVCRDDKRYN